MASSAPAAPNHHAHHRGFSGITGALAALTMTVGRDGDARLAAELTGLGPDDVLVDVGCGPGTAARHAASLGARVVAVDPADVMRRVGDVLTRRQPVTFVDGAAERLPVGDGEATVVWTLASVHHWIDVDAGLAEVRRVLRPGGRFLAMERRVRAGATGLASHGWTPPQADAFADLCRAAGFVELRVEEHPSRRGGALCVLGSAPAPEPSRARPTSA
jgi:ubiquinone/menaquinone biosynthesis C-methylase UbiE